MRNEWDRDGLKEWAQALLRRLASRVVRWVISPEKNHPVPELPAAEEVAEGEIKWLLAELKVSSLM
jgi:hypothetical protein